jgi:hypothetical protein
MEGDFVDERGAVVGAVGEDMALAPDGADHEWAAIKPMLPNKPRGVPRVNDRRVLWNSVALRDWTEHRRGEDCFQVERRFAGVAEAVSVTGRHD